MPTSRQSLHGGGTEVLAVVAAHHTEAGSPAIRAVVLFVEVIFAHGELCIFHLRFYQNQHWILIIVRLFPIHQILVIKGGFRYKDGI